MVRVLLLGDTHLGFDLPRRPRIERRRRGPDFFDAFRRALAPARRGEVDLVVHGGDLLFRRRVPAWLVHLAMEPIFEVADRGVPVFLVPGNHERSRIPFPLLTQHPEVHIFDGPRTFALRCGGRTVGVAGFPFVRTVAGRAFAAEVARTGWEKIEADVRLLCMHQAVEGAQVGAQNYTFRRGADVVAGRELPRGFTAFLSGHIHRAQVLTHDLAGRELVGPVIYPGSTERTSFAERYEEKGYYLLEISEERGVRPRFVPLPTRPMSLLSLPLSGLDRAALTSLLRAKLEGLRPDAVVKLQPRGVPRPEAGAVLTAANLRRLAPATMNVDLARPRRAAGQ